MKEYVIWGKSPENPTLENLLVSERAGLTSLAHAKQVLNLLESKHGCFDCRIQTLDLSEPLSWDAANMVNV